MYDFFSLSGIDFRALALKSGPYEYENPSAIFTNEGIFEGLYNIFVRKMESNNQVNVDPINGYSQTVLLKMAGLARQKYFRSEHGDKVIIVNTDGKLYLRRDAYTTTIGDLNGTSIEYMY
ncbi:hypothetical protein [Janthinobacterium sp. 64]|uniref:hypothetical protein n=1 Tax=Janthinobacterium sp. 64 TaxID=2035208 RepID=UPI000C2C7F67|nr:hypothetical protein [Janthinobacterium sp. 64]